MAAAAKPRVYHISPWRFLWIWLPFGPIALVFLGAGAFSHVPKEQAEFLIGGALFLGVTLCIHVLVRFARLELSEQGIRLRQFGYRLESPWSDLSDLWLDRGHEGLITSRPVGGKGQALLASSAHAVTGMFLGAGPYTAEQQALLDEWRLIPIEAFAWHVRHGKLRSDLEHFAPHLRTVLAHSDAPAPAPSTATPHPPTSRQPRPKATFRQWATFLLIILGIASLLAFAFTSKSHEQIAYRISGILFPASLALSMGIGARGCFRIGSWLAGTGLVLVAILLGLWAFAAASSLADMLGASRAFMRCVATLLFALLALGAASGTRRAFRRHSRVLGVVFLLCAVFLIFCAVVSGFDLGKPH